MSAKHSTSVYRYDLIDDAMIAQNYTNERLAKACGLAVATISSIRNGRPNITLPSLVKVATILGITMRQLFMSKAA